MSVYTLKLLISVLLLINLCVGITVNFDRDTSITEISKNLFKNYENSLIIYVIVTRTNASRIDENVFSEMTSLLSLDLQSNEIRSLGKDLFKNNHKLEDLRISGNGIEELPKEIFSSLTYLKELDISKNNIKYLPESVFSNLKELQTLKLFNNAISEIPANLFSNLSKLSKLFLYNNLISKIHPDTFNKNSELEYISLSSNNLTKIESGTFSSLNQLTSLDISYNEITLIEDDSLPKNITNYFLLNNNNLQNLSPDILLVGLDARYAYYCPNPWNCNSKMIDMFKVWKEHFARRPIGQICVCKEPKKLEGRLLDELTEEDFS